MMINYHRFDGYGIAGEMPMPRSLYFQNMFYNMAAAVLVGAALAPVG